MASVDQDAPPVEAEIETGGSDYADEVAGLSAMQIVDKAPEVAEGALQVRGINEPEPEAAPEPVNLISKTDFRAMFRKVFDLPQHVPKETPVIGPVFGPDWAAFAISGMDESGFNCLSDKIYDGIKLIVPSILRESENSAILIVMFLASKAYVVKTIFDTRALELAAAAEDAKPDNMGEFIHAE